MNDFLTKEMTLEEYDSIIIKQYLEKYNNNVENFLLINELKLSKNDLIVFSPYVFRSIESPLVQCLYFSTKVE